MLTRIVRVDCDRCKASQTEGPLTGWIELQAHTMSDGAGASAGHLCPACADRFRWFMAGGPVLDELEEESPSGE